MAVGLTGLPVLLPVPGIRLGTACAGIRKKDRRDLVVIECQPGTRAAAVFTRNRFCAAPVLVAREHLAAMSPRLLLINTGYANAGTGEPGLADARYSCEALSRLAACQPAEVLPFSTGVIGERFPLDRLVTGLPAAMASLSGEGWAEAAHGIMTTDTVAKGVSRQLAIAGRTVTVTGICKGSGMIHPDMATMLAFIATDAAVAQSALDRLLRDAVDQSFNCATVDGDTSTNDACLLLATGQAGNPAINSTEGREYSALRAAVIDLCRELAQMIVRDGEGATKFMTISVSGAASEDDAREVAFAVAHSPLVKTAFFASDPNWGRILAAVGRAPIAQLDVNRVSVHLNQVRVVHQGALDPGYREEQGAAAMRESEITVRIDLASGSHEATVWTCDFSHDYVRINAEYRS